MNIKSLMVYLGLLVVSLSALSAKDLTGIRDLASKGRTAEALADLERQQATEPVDTESRLLQGVLLVELGRMEEAERVFLGLTRENPNLPEPYNNLAVLYGESGEFDKAIEVLKQALGTDPSYKAAYENLTRVYGHLAGEAYQKALGAEGSESERLERLAMLSEVSAPAVVMAKMPAAPPEAEPEPVTVDTTPTVVEMEADPKVEIEQAVRAWAQAWSSQNPDSYLSFYASDFVPTGGVGRRQWESLRRRRLVSPKSIEIIVGAVQVEFVDDRTARVSFPQEYKSDTFSDKVTKSLDLVWENGAWKIHRERSEG